MSLSEKFNSVFSSSFIKFGSIDFSSKAILLSIFKSKYFIHFFTKLSLKSVAFSSS